MPPAEHTHKPQLAEYTVLPKNKQPACKLALLTWMRLELSKQDKAKKQRQLSDLHMNISQWVYYIDLEYIWGEVQLCTAGYIGSTQIQP